MPYVYRHIRLDKNEPFYIGIGSDNRHKRARNRSERSQRWKNIVGSSDYEVEILLEGLTWQEACAKEKEFISLYGRVDNGTGILCNFTDGGEGVCGMKYKMTDDHKKKISIRNMGRVFSKETKLKISLAKKGVYKKRKKLTEEQRQVLSNAAKGKKMSEEAKKKMSKTQKLPILQYDLNGNFIKEWDGIVDAAKELNAYSTGISRCCQHIFRQAYGFIWEYKNGDQLGKKKRKPTTTNKLTY